MIVDDIQLPPGTVMQDLVDRGLLKVIEQFGPYPQKHALNPCMRTLYGPLCFPWGYAVATFTSNATDDRRAPMNSSLDGLGKISVGGRGQGGGIAAYRGHAGTARDVASRNS
jgi:hypothetical protein